MNIFLCFLTHISYLYCIPFLQDRVKGFVEVSGSGGKGVEILVKLGLEGVKRGGEGADDSRRLLLDVAGCSDEGCKRVTSGLGAMHKQASSGEEKERAEKALLFQYCEMYDKVVLTNELKMVLFNAAGKHWDGFVSCKSNIDGRFADGLNDLKSIEFSNIGRGGVVELAKTHPLLVCRKVEMLRQVLLEDATAGRLEGDGNGVCAKVGGEPPRVDSGDGNNDKVPDYAPNRSPGIITSYNEYLSLYGAGRHVSIVGPEWQAYKAKHADKVPDFAPKKSHKKVVIATYNEYVVPAPAPAAPAPAPAPAAPAPAPAPAAPAPAAPAPVPIPDAQQMMQMIMQQRQQMQLMEERQRQLELVGAKRAAPASPDEQESSKKQKKERVPIPKPNTGVLRKDVEDNYVASSSDDEASSSDDEASSSDEI